MSRAAFHSSVVLLVLLAGEDELIRTFSHDMINNLLYYYSLMPLS